MAIPAPHFRTSYCPAPVEDGQEPPEVEADPPIGVGLNAGHLAVAETDASGKSHHQAEAIIGNAVARVVAYARAVGKPIVIEGSSYLERQSPHRALLDAKRGGD